VLLDTSNLNRFIGFDKERGVVRCEAGTTLAQILQLVLPAGWFLPVTPGTKYITVGGAIGNDVHGKNHHVAGTFCCHVRKFELLRSSGERMICSSDENEEMYRATIGGLGLTGLILWAEIQLKKVSGELIDEEVIMMRSIDDFFSLAGQSDEAYDYTVAWLDCQAGGRSLGKGLFMRGNHAQGRQGAKKAKAWMKPKIKWPVEGPPGMINKYTVKLFNTAFYYKNLRPRIKRQVHFDKFFYPLDGVDNWNRIYGAKGFLQYQFVVPKERAEETMRVVLEKIVGSGEASFLSTMKYFGDVKSPGFMSFPRPGLVLAVDFMNSGGKTRQLLDGLDEIVVSSGGAINPSKDSRMSGKVFRLSYPRLAQFSRYIDPSFSSGFWQRVCQSE